MYTYTVYHSLFNDRVFMMQYIPEDWHLPIPTISRGKNTQIAAPRGRPLLQLTQMDLATNMGDILSSKSSKSSNWLTRFGDVSSH